MHRFASSSIIFRLRAAAFLFCLKCLLVPVVVGLLVYSFVEHDRELTIMAIGLGVLTAILLFVQWMVAVRARCPLCMTPVLANKRCSKHRNARTLLGSHRLRVSLAILFKGRFHCPYCHEPSVLEVRNRLRQLEARARSR